MTEFKPIPLKPTTLTMSGISKKTMEEHFKLYEGYVKKTNEISLKLETVDKSTANQSYSDLRSLKVEYTFALGGVKNHEVYFDVLGGQGGKPEGDLLKQIETDFGSYENWLTDLKASGLAARGWVWLAYDRDQKKLFNFVGDSQNTYVAWNTVPILALDTYEHAYYLDYAVDRKSYIEAFVNNLDWQAVDNRFKAI